MSVECTACCPHRARPSANMQICTCVSTAPPPPCRRPCWAGTRSWWRAPPTRPTCLALTGSAAGGRSAPRCACRASTWRLLRWRASCTCWWVPPAARVAKIGRLPPSLGVQSGLRARHHVCSAQVFAVARPPLAAATCNPMRLHDHPCPTGWPCGAGQGCGGAPRRRDLRPPEQLLARGAAHGRPPHLPRGGAPGRPAVCGGGAGLAQHPRHVRSVRSRCRALGHAGRAPAAAPQVLGPRSRSRWGWVGWGGCGLGGVGAGA